MTSLQSGTRSMATRWYAPGLLLLLLAAGFPALAAAPVATVETTSHDHVLLDAPYRTTTVPKVWLVQRTEWPDPGVLRKLDLGSVVEVLEPGGEWTFVETLDLLHQRGYVMSHLIVPASADVVQRATEAERAAIQSTAAARVQDREAELQRAEAGLASERARHARVSQDITRRQLAILDARSRVQDARIALRGLDAEQAPQPAPVPATLPARRATEPLPPAAPEPMTPPSADEVPVAKPAPVSPADPSPPAAQAPQASGAAAEPEAVASEEAPEAIGTPLASTLGAAARERSSAPKLVIPALPATEAVQQEAQPPALAGGVPSLPIGRVILVTLALLIAAGAAMALQRRKKQDVASSASLSTVSTLSLGKDRSLALVEAPGQLLVLGTTPGGVNLVAELAQTDYDPAADRQTGDPPAPAAADPEIDEPPHPLDVARRKRTETHRAAWATLPETPALRRLAAARQQALGGLG